MLLLYYQPYMKKNIRKQDITSAIKSHSLEVDSYRKEALVNMEVLESFVKALIQLLGVQAYRAQAYEEVMQLCIGGGEEVLAVMGKQVFPVLASNHLEGPLDAYVIVWKRMFQGKGRSYDQIYATLRTIRIENEHMAIPRQVKEQQRQFNQIVEGQRSKRVEFFEDDESFMSSSYDEHLSDILLMDIEELATIRKLVETNHTLDERQAQQYLIKMKNFLSLQPQSIPTHITSQYQQQRTWALHFIQNYQKYMQKKVSDLIQPQIQEYEEIIIQEQPQPNHTFNKKRTIFKKQINHPENTQLPLQSSHKVSKIQDNTNKNIYSSRYPMHQSKFQQQNMVQQGGKQPNFILNTSEMNQLMVKNPSDRSSHVRQKIFSMKNSRNAQFSQMRESIQEEPEHLSIVKHGQRENSVENVENLQNFDNVQIQASKYRGSRSKSKKVESPWSKGSPSPSIKNTRLYDSRKKLSDLTSQKKQRRRIAPKTHISEVESYILNPYTMHCMENFTHFRRNCLQDNFTLYASAQLIVSCIITRLVNSKIKIELLYSNSSKLNLMMSTLYRIPKCFIIEKVTKIQKKFLLTDHVQHVFTLDMEWFPLQACLLNLSFKSGREEIFPEPIPILMPITLKNFVQCLMIGAEEWKRLWEKWSGEVENFRTEKHTMLDKSVVGDERLGEVLHEFVYLGAVEGYSIHEYGCYCRHPSFNQITFLLRLSLRVDTIITLELLTNQPISEHQDECDFLQLYLDNWMMILSRLQGSKF